MWYCKNLKEREYTLSYFHFTWLVNTFIYSRASEVEAQDNDSLPHWVVMTHICVSELTVRPLLVQIMLVACLVPSHYLDQYWSYRSLGTNFSEIWVKIWWFWSRKINLKMLSVRYLFISGSASSSISNGALKNCGLGSSLSCCKPPCDWSSLASSSSILESSSSTARVLSFSISISTSE